MQATAIPEISATQRRAVLLTGLALAVCFLVLAVFGITSLPRMVDFLRVHPARSLGGQIRAGDFFLMAAGLAAAMSVAILEWREGALRRLLSGESRPLLIFVLVAASLWFAHPMMAPGLIPTGDAGAHVTRVAHLMAALQNGDSLVWDNAYYGGSSLLQFTGPMVHWMGAAAGLLLGSATSGIKSVLVLCRIASVLFMFAYLRRLRLSDAACFLGAIAYGSAYIQSYLTIVRSTFPQGINLALLPVIFLCIEIILAQGRFRTAASIALALCGIAAIGNHQPTALIVFLYSAIYTATRLSMLGWTRGRVLPFVLAGLGIGLGSIFFVLPFLAEKSWSAYNFSGDLLYIVHPDMRDFYQWGFKGDGKSYAIYLGTSVLLSFASGFLLLAKGAFPDGQRKLWLLIAGLFFISLVIGGDYVRILIFTQFFVSVGAAIAIDGWQRVRRIRAWLPVFLFLLMIADFGPLNFQPWTKESLLPLEAASHYLADYAGNERVLEINWLGAPRIWVDTGASPLGFSRAQFLTGPHKMDATPAHNAIIATLKLAEADLVNTGRLGIVAGQLLSQYNVGLIVGDRDAELGLPESWQGTVPNPVLGRILHISTATPFLISAHLAAAPRPEALGGEPMWNVDFPGRGTDAEKGILQTWQDMGVSLNDDAAQRFVIPSDRALPQWARIPLSGTPHAKLISYHVTSGDVGLSVESDAPGFIRLAHPFTPMLSVTIDGKKVQPIPDLFWMTVLPLHAGRNDIAIVPAPTLLRRLCFAITAATLGGLLVALCLSVARALARAPIGSVAKSVKAPIGPAP